MSQTQNDDPGRGPDTEAEKKKAHQADTQENPPPKNPLRPDHKTRRTEPYQVSEAGGPLPELDEGPRPTAVDDIQAALFEAQRQGSPAELDFDRLPAPQPDFAEVTEEEAPEPGPDTEDEILRAIQSASQHGVSPEVSFEDLPRPRPYPQKKISRPVKPIIEPPSQVETEAVHRAEPEPQPAPSPIIEPDAPKDAGVQSVLWTPEISDSAVEINPQSEPTTLEPTVIEETTDFRLILALFVTFRLLTLFLLRPGGFIRDWSDFDTYLGIASLSDYSLYPFVHFWLEWPPLVPWLTVGVYRLSLFFPPWAEDPRLWFILLLGGVFLLFEISNFVLIHRLARRLFADPATRTRVLWLYAGLFPPIYAMLGFFDGVALFFILLSLELLLTNQRFPAAIASGVGFLVKIIPALMLPVAVRTIWDQHRPNRQEAGVELGLYAVAFGLTIIILLLPFLILGPEWVVASARSMTDRSAWETIWAVVDGYYGFGAVAGERLNPNETAFAIYQSDLPILFWPLITLLFGLIYAFFFTRPADYRQPRNVIAFGGLTVALFMLYSKGYSPQFLIYLLPFILLLLPNGRGLTYALMLTGLNVLEQPIYFVLLPEAHWLLIFVVVARFMLVGVLLFEFAAVLWPEGVWLQPILALQPRAVPILAGLSALGLVILTPLLFQAYAANRLNEEQPVGILAGFMAAQARQAGTLSSCQQAFRTPLLLSEQATYRQLYAPLSRDFDLQLVAGAPEQSSFPPPAQLIPTEGSAWVLPTGPQARALQNAATNRGRSPASFTFEGLGTLSLFDFSATNTPNCSAPARFRADIELLTHQIEVSGGGVDVTLYWRVLAEQRQSLTVFSQILNAEGQQVAGHDSVPRNGTFPMTEWPVESVQADVHHIELPANLPPGQYTIIVGLYNSFSERLAVTTADGQTYPNRAVPLAVVELP